MRLNNLRPAEGSRPDKKRLGRGIGSGLGKTSGKGHKGQKARAGGFHKVGFEGGQMPLQRRLPKRGFRSHMKDQTAELRLEQLNAVAAEHDVIDMAVLKQHKLIDVNAEKVKVFVKGTLNKAVHLKGIECSAGAVAAIEAAGGSVSE